MYIIRKEATPMTHKLRTLQGQLRSAIQRNATLAAERDAALHDAHSALCAYHEAVHQRDEARRHANQREIDYNAAVRRAYTVETLNESFRLLAIRISLSDLHSAKSQSDALAGITQNIAHQA
jgi:hypothetical protein